MNPAATGRLDGDLGAVVRIGLDAVLLPKVERPEEIHSLDRALGELEARTGLEAGSMAIVAAIESARGIEKAVDILCASERLEAVMFGAEDLALDLGLPVRRRGGGQEMLYARSAESGLSTRSGWTSETSTVCVPRRSPGGTWDSPASA